MVISTWMYYCQCRLNSREQCTSFLLSVAVAFYSVGFYLPSELICRQAAHCFWLRRNLFFMTVHSICVALWSLSSRRFSTKPCLKRPLKGECQWTLNIKSRMSGRNIGSVTGSREMKRRMRKAMITADLP